jgi:hypothetical protein
MAEVTSLTEQRIMQLASEWVSVADNQETTAAFVGMLKTFLEQNQAKLSELNEQTIPQLLETLAANEISVSELNENVLPDLQSALDENATALADLNTVAIPALQIGLENEIENARARPHVYVQPEAPTNPDEDDRYLVVGDSWFDSDDNNRQTVWNGVEWSTFNIDIPDLSITVKKFKTSTHMIY